MLTLTTKISPDYQISDYDYFLKVVTIPGFRLYYFTGSLSNKPSCLDLPTLSVEIDLIRSPGNILEGESQKFFEKQNLKQVDFPTFCQFILDNPEFCKDLYIAAEWKSFGMCCNCGDISLYNIDTKNKTKKLWGEGWYFIGKK